ncbi:MAG: NUDIX hydrolase [Candidatus Thermoplasmatota archaeon]|nr:NUDIX hydrolase [Candidatus Thermoplasmatota archaeon]
MVSDMALCDECQGYLNPALAVDACVRQGDSILLVQRKFPPSAGSWVLPGGFVDQGERPEEAVLRELKEEAGLDGTNPQLLMVMGDPTRDPRKHIVSIVYEVEATGHPVGGDDAQDARFWPISEILEGRLVLAGDHGEIVEAWLNQSIQSQ